MQRVGLLAGDGNLPLVFAHGARTREVEVVAISVTPNALAAELAEIVDEHYQLSVAQLGAVIAKLKELDVEEVVMAGKVNKDLMFALDFDQRAMTLLNRLQEKNDDSILLALVNELESEGIKVKQQTTYLEELFPEIGQLNDVEPSEEDLFNMEFGFKMAKGIGALDIGQTVVVRDGAVIAVEAIEGTDKAILRSGELAPGDMIVAKVSKPEQDFRFDIPTIGMQTMENLIKVGARGIVIEAGKTFILDETEVLAKANQAGISVVAMGWQDEQGVISSR
ncbi:LpxI family protein [Fuchsiella alkaliacetigena]|uniref:LpxI family protein n=1 Tax=Fuchsiella alkaliacetigena TaxID=957042 RepID=UPI00200B5F97|nr:UDP-2,3-diacylglucosamine diphosphatase LpxI [Fuchsiella alkaliacetigena]MCK8824271.1 UDP-2,3-diacylglucosamine diphosphatase LpxI [Fuchsiella alkaliacetigena]